MWVDHRKNQGVSKPSKATSSTRMATRLTRQHCWDFKIEIALISQNPVTVLYLNILYFYKWRRQLLLFSKAHTENKRHSQAFITRSPRTSGFQSSHDVSKPSAKRMQKFLKWPLLTRDSEEQAVMRVLSMVSTKAEPVSRSPLWLDCKIYWETRQKVTTFIFGNSHRIQGHKNP